MGAGMIFPVIWDDHTVEAFSIPMWWEKAYSVDPGWGLTAAAFFARDPDSGIIYLYSEHYLGQQVPAIHAEAIKSRGQWMDGLIDTSANATRDSGDTLRHEYERLGLNLYDANKAFYPSVSKVLTALNSGTFKIFKTCVNAINEFRTYRYDNNPSRAGMAAPGQKDHLVDATRYFFNNGFALFRPSPEAEEAFSNYYDQTYSQRTRNPVTGY
jgi:Terminase RNaseH-like domain